MSVRRTDVEQVVETASRFSLRGVVTAETLNFRGTSPAANQETQATLLQQQQIQRPLNTSTLKFTLPQNRAQTQAPAHNKGSIVAQRASTALAPSTSSVFKLAAPRQMATGNRAGNRAGPVDSAEVLRLTVYVDDLTQRLRDTGTKLQKAEVTLARTNQALVAERHAATQKITHMRKDLSISHELEGKLRTEIHAQAAKQVQSVTTQNDFITTVRSALATQQITDQQQSDFLDLENRVAALSEDKQKIEALIADLGMERTGAQLELKDVQSTLASYVEKSKKLSRNIEEQEVRLSALQQVAPQPSHEAAHEPSAVAPADFYQESYGACHSDEPYGGAERESDTDTDTDTDDEFTLHTSIPTAIADDDDEKENVYYQSSSPPYNAPFHSVPDLVHEVIGSMPDSIVSVGFGALAHARRTLPDMHFSEHFEIDCPLSLNKISTKAPEPTAGAGHMDMHGLLQAIVIDVKAMLENSKNEIREMERKHDKTPALKYPFAH